jgi:hypothetical protein
MFLAVIPANAGIQSLIVTPEQSRIKIAPLRIPCFDEFDLPCPRPFLDRHMDPSWNSSMSLDPGLRRDDEH